MRGVLFDFNGTMFFDEKFQTASWRKFLQQKTGRAIADREFQEYVHGRNADFTLPYFLARKLEREEIAALEEEKEAIYRELCLKSEDFHLAEGLPEFLDELLRRRIPMTIATASGRNNVKFFFEHLQLDRWFQFEKVVFNDGSFPGKPEPDIYQKAAEKIGADIRDCIVFEDAKSGIQAAKRASVRRIVGVASMQDSAELLALGATHVIQNYSDWKRLLAVIEE